MELGNAGRVSLHGIDVLKMSTKCTADKSPPKLFYIGLNPLSKLDCKHPALTYRLTRGVIILETIPRRAAAQAMLLGRILRAEMFTAPIIHGTVAVFDLCGKSKQQERGRVWKSESQKGNVARSCFKWLTAVNGFGMTVVGFKDPQATRK